MVDDQVIQARMTPNGHYRFSRAELIKVNPALDNINPKLNRTYLRPKRLITSIYRQTEDKGDLSMIYLRDSAACLAFCKGFQGVTAGALSLMIDVMAQHKDQKGIPAVPASYIAGLLGIGQRKWSQTVEPELMAAGRIKIVKRGGIDVYVFPDKFMVGDHALFRFDQKDAVPQWVEAVEAGPQTVRADMNFKTKGPDSFESDLTIVEAEDAPDGQYIKLGDDGGLELVDTSSGEIVSTAKILDQEEGEALPHPVEPDEPRMPERSAYEVLKQAGVPVDDHERGELFWHRVEHGEVLAKWLRDGLTINQVVDRIARSVQAGHLPEPLNSMIALEHIVLEG